MHHITSPHLIVILLLLHLVFLSFHPGCFYLFLIFFLLFSALCIGVGSTGVFGHYGAFKMAHIDQRCFVEMESGKNVHNIRLYRI